MTEPNHGRSNSDTVRFRNVDGSPGGLAYTVFENSSGFSISSVTTNTYVFDCGSNATVTEKSGGLTLLQQDQLLSKHNGRIKRFRIKNTNKKVIQR